MPKLAINLARQLLSRVEDSLEDLEVHEFKDDAAAHDDNAMDRLHADFETKFERVQAELSATYGVPSRTGAADDVLIQLCGVFRFAVWVVEGRQLYVALAHEDRDCPILLMLGTAPR